MHRLAVRTESPAAIEQGSGVASLISIVLIG